MKTKEELQKKTVSELAKICKDNSIPHYHGKNRFRKSELIDAILGAESAKESETKKIAKLGEEVVNGLEAGMQSAKDEVKIDGRNNNVEVKSKVEKELANVDMTQKMPYIESAEVGVLVAFRLPNGKVKSAKIIKKSTKNRRLKLETDYGAQYIVSFDDVIWVRTGKRWPRGVYKLLKGLVGDERAS